LSDRSRERSELVFPFGDYSEEIRPDPLPERIHPSCRYLPSRVLKRGCAMTRIGYIKPQALSSPSRPSHSHQTTGSQSFPSSSRLRPTSRYYPFQHRLGSGASLGFSPFQRHHHPTGQTEFHSRSLPPTGFRNLTAGLRPQRLAGLFHPAGTPRVRPSEVDSRPIGARSRTPRLLRRYPPFMDSFRGTGTVPTARPPRHYPVAAPTPRPLVALQRPASILGLSRPWSFGPDRERLVHRWVSPQRRDGTSLGLSLPQGFVHRLPWA